MSPRYSQNNEEDLVREFFGSDDQSRLSCLDIGANDGETLSNTCACIDRGWSAVLVEPSPICVERAKARHGANPRVHIVPCAVGVQEGKATFWESGSHLSSADHSLLSTLRQEETKRWTRETFTETTVNVVTVDTVLKLAAGCGIVTFDLISIDVEGLDYDVLMQLDLSRLGCRMLIVEYNSIGEGKYIDRCSGFGMGLMTKNAENLIFVRR
jgi:FkbM family methyltransferase